MSRRNVMQTVGAVAACVVLSGCMPKMTIEEMKAHMPKRPVELDRLNAFVGTWEHEGVAKFSCLDQALKTSGRSEVKWEGNRWYLLGNCDMKMENFDDTKACEIWTYDIHTKKYRSSWVDSMGMMAAGEGTCDPITGTWHMTATNHTPWGASHLKGTMRFLDENTTEWSMTETVGLQTILEMSGRSKRVK
ncbi:MAG: DUF1579 family protein [Phycisphaerae bacterium]|nr:DUF1579 family protein [Phycisphaerae bacterium]